MSKGSSARLTSLADARNRIRIVEGAGVKKQSANDKEQRPDGPVNTCLAPNCKNTFQIPWGYYDDGKELGDPTKALWSGACGIQCSIILDEEKKKESHAQEVAFLAKFGLS
jgi:hypothetical protein